MAFKYDWEEFICNTLAKAREMAGDKAKDFEVVIGVKDNDGAPPLVNGAYNYWTGDFFAQLDEVDWENGLPEFASEVERKAGKVAEYDLELLNDEMKDRGLSFDNPEDEREIERLTEQYESEWFFSVVVHKEPEGHNHFYGHGGIGAEFTAPYYIYDSCSGEFNEDGMGDDGEVEEKFLEDFAKALEKDDGVNESRRPRGRMLREGRRPVRRGRFLTEDRIRKSKPIAVIQGNYGYGWDDESSYDMDDVGYLKSIKHDFDEYRKSGHNALYRIVHKRQKLDKPQKFVKGEWLDVEDEPVKTEACGKRKKGKKVIKEKRLMKESNGKISVNEIVARLLEDEIQNEYLYSMPNKHLGNKFLEDSELRRPWGAHEGLARNVKMNDVSRDIDIADWESFYMYVEDFYNSVNDDLREEYGIEAYPTGRSGGWFTISDESVGKLITKDAKENAIEVVNKEAWKKFVTDLVNDSMEWYDAELAGETEFDPEDGRVNAFLNQVVYDMEDRELYEDMDFSWFRFPSIEKYMSEIDGAIENTLRYWEENGKELFGGETEE